MVPSNQPHLWGGWITSKKCSRTQICRLFERNRPFEKPSVAFMFSVFTFNTLLPTNTNRFSMNLFCLERLTRLIWKLDQQITLLIIMKLYRTLILIWREWFATIVLWTGQRSGHIPGSWGPVPPHKGCGTGLQHILVFRSGPLRRCP